MTRAPARLAVALSCAALTALAAAPASAGVSLVPAYTDSATDPVSGPISVTAPPSDSSRLFVVERQGRIRLAVDGVMQTTPFLDISSLVDTAGEGGLLSMALAPDYSASGLLYVYFVEPPDSGAANGDIRIEEFQRSGADPNVADPASRRLVLEIQHDTYSNHYGGQLQFGSDGYLYAGTGDGGSGGDPLGNGQSTKQVLGKLLRIDPRVNGASPYSIPADNPYSAQALCNTATGAHDCPEIAAYGLRNPFRFSFDRDNGALVIGDVGQAAWEEVDYAAAGSILGSNFGWNCYEGPGPYGGGCVAPGYVAPIFTYPNPNGASPPSAAITGGVVVRDPALVPLAGRYLYADFYEGRIRSLLPTTPSAGDARVEALPTVPMLVSFGQDADGRVYVASLGGSAPYGGKVWRLECDSSCTTPPGGGGTGGGGTGGGGTTDPPLPPPADTPVPAPDGTTPTAVTHTTAPLLHVHGARVQDVLRRRRVRLAISCDEACIARVSAAALGIPLRGVLVRLTPGGVRTIDLPASLRLRRVLARSRRATATVSVRARDAAGNLSVAKLVVRVKLPR